MAPFFNPDSAEVSEVILPDAASASEVVAPDGSRVFGAMPDSGILRYDFDEGGGSTATDLWNSNDGTINGATYTTDSEVGSHALSFDGDDNVDIGSLGFSDDAPFSYALWIKPATISSNRDDIFGDGSERKNLSIDGSGNVALRFFDGSEHLINGTTTLSTGTYYFVAGTFDGSTARVYVNGNEEGSGTAGYTNSTSNGMAVRDSEEADPFIGIADDLRVYDKALSSTEVSNLYNNGAI